MSYRIVYFAFVGDKFEGVEQKIIAQFDALTALGAHINLYFISRYTPGKTLFTEVAKRRNVEILVNTSQNTRNPLSRRKEKFKLISKVLSHFNPGDTIIYLRYPLADFLFLKFLKRNKAFKFVTEHQDIEYSSIKGWQRIMEIIWGRPVRRRITGFVGVTSEITEFERSCTHGKDHYFATIGNGIDIRKYPLRIPIHENSNSEIRMLFVGGGQLHHGLDRLIESMHLYFKNGNNGIDFRLKIAGSSDVMQKNVKLAEKFELLPKINFLGNIDNENLNDLFNWADVGVASLGLHKIGLSKSSTLKTKEYFMRGLPFFWSSADDDFPVNCPYILQLKAEDSPFDLSELIPFTEKIKLKKDLPQKMRQYAIDRLDWSAKMKELITFLDEINRNVHG